MNPNLWSRTSYTFFSSFLSIEKLITFALNNNYEEVSLIEKNVFYSANRFYELAKKNNLKPIIGLEIDIKNYNKILIAKNYDGYKNLLKISSLINTHGTFSEDIINENVIKIDKKFPIHSFINNDDKEELLLFSKHNNIVLENEIEKLLTKEEFIEKYGLDKLKKIEKIYSQVNLEIPKTKISFPERFFLDEGNSHNLLKKKLVNNLQKFLSKDKLLDKNLYLKRINYEFEIISKMKFESYFLMVEDIVNWAKDNNILVGPGRGSAAGSLVIFLLNITEIDPIKNNLIFERFLNPERISLPDIDIDFEDVKREKVINYIVKRFGHEYVASIITFQSFKAKLAFKDSLRIFEVSPIEANQITKLMKDEKSLIENYNSIKNLRFLIEENLNVKKAFEFAKKIEGLERQFSTHAAGIVIANEKIENFVPIQNGYNENILQTQYSMDYLENNGLIKVDILGLRNLTFISEIITLIYKHFDRTIDLNEINLNDDQVYKIFSEGKTAGIFQFESPGMMKILKELKPDCFEDLVASTSLFRPGPMQQIPHFVKRKHNLEKIEVIDSSFEHVLKSTYGVIVYQEQILEIVKIFAGFSYAKADIFRRAIGKKDENTLHIIRQDFFEGARNLNHNESKIEHVYNLIFEFANYGFNRSHAFAYSLISYKLAWLKKYFTLEFAASLLNSTIGNKEKTNNYILEFNKMGIEIVHCSLKNTLFKYSKISDNVIQIGLESLIGIGTNTLKEIVYEREKGEFIDFIDFVARINNRSVTKTNIRTIIKSGCLDFFKISRNTMLQNLETVLEYAKLITLKEGQNFIIDYSIMSKPILKEFPKTNYAQFEIEAYGFSLQKSKINVYKKTIKNKFSQLVDIEFLEDIQDKNYVIFGELSNIRKIKTKNNQEMAYITFNDGTGEIDTILWPAIYYKFKDEINIGNIYIIEGKIDLKRNKNLIVKQLKKYEHME